MFSFEGQGSVGERTSLRGLPAQLVDQGQAGVGSGEAGWGGQFLAERDGLVVAGRGLVQLAQLEVEVRAAGQQRGSECAPDGGLDQSQTLLVRPRGLGPAGQVREGGGEEAEGLDEVGGERGGLVPGQLDRPGQVGGRLLRPAQFSGRRAQVPEVFDDPFVT